MKTALAMTAAMLGSLLLAACASPRQGTPGAVHDRMGAELRQAAAERKGSDALDSALMPPLAVEMPQAEAEPRFDLAVVNAPAAQVFMAIVTGTRYSMLVTPDVSGQITVNLKDVTVKEALEAIRELYGYEFTVKGNRIQIEPNTMRSKVFQVNYLASRRSGASELRVTSSAIAGSGAGSGSTSSPAAGGVPAPGGTGGGASMGSLTSRVQTSTDSDFWGGLATALRAIVGTGGGSVDINSQSGIVVVRALPREMRLVESYLRATQAVVERQVMLEAKIIEVTLNESYSSGVNWAAFGSGPNNSSHSAVGAVGGGANLIASSTAGAVSAMSNSGMSTVVPGNAGAVVANSLGKGFFGLAFQSANFAALLSFLETQGTVSVLSSPRIATLNNQKAVLKVGTDELFVTNITTTTTSTTSGSVSTPSLTLAPYFSGISLDVTPQIDGDSNIILHVHPSVSVVREKEKSIDLGTNLGQFKLPLASSSINETDSIVRARDGNIVAIGGLMSQGQTMDRNQLPGAGGNPLFGQRAATLAKRELVILIKPTIIADDRVWVRDLEQVGERLRDLDPRQLESATR